MALGTALKKLAVAETGPSVAAGAAYVDLRSVGDYLDVHVPGSLSLQYEAGPGLPGRARDCIPLHVPLVLLEEEGVDSEEVAAALRGKGFTVEGVLAGGLTAWASASGTPASCDVLDGPAEPAGTVLHVNDPGSVAPEGAVNIPIERLWGEVGRIPPDRPAIVVGGSGLRAALAVGILERAGVEGVTFWWRKRITPPAKKERARSFLRPFSD